MRVLDEAKEPPLRCDEFEEVRDGIVEMVPFLPPLLELRVVPLVLGRYGRVDAIGKLGLGSPLFGNRSMKDVVCLISHKLRQGLNSRMETISCHYIE